MNSDVNVYQRIYNYPLSQSFTEKYQAPQLPRSLDPLDQLETAGAALDVQACSMLLCTSTVLKLTSPWSRVTGARGLWNGCWSPHKGGMWMYCIYFYIMVWMVLIYLSLWIIVDRIALLGYVWIIIQFLLMSTTNQVTSHWWIRFVLVPSGAIKHGWLEKLLFVDT